MIDLKKQISFLLLLSFVAGLILFPGSRRLSGAGLEAEMVIFNGKILTADNADVKSYKTAQAAAVYDGKFVAVGSNEEVMQYAGPGTKKVDLGGRTVIPGLIETHDHIYDAAAHFFPKGAPRVAETDPGISWTNKADFLAQIQTLALKKKPGEWIITSPRGGEMGIVPELQRGEVTRFDLDKVTPNNPLYIHWEVLVNGLLNTKALQPLLDAYPKVEGIMRDAKGVPTGRIGGVANPLYWYEFMPQVAPDKLAPYYKMEMEEIAAQGITTASTRLLPNHLSAYSLLNVRGELPVRMAYTQESMSRSEFTNAIASRVSGLQGGSGKDMWGAGDDKLWIIGITPISLDSVAGTAGACVRKEYPREAPDFPLWRFQFYGPHGICRLKNAEYPDIDVIRMAAKYGFRISGMHVSGDRAADEFFDAVEEASKQYPDILERRWAIDHCQIVHADQIERAAKLHIMFSCSPTYLYGGDKGGVGAFKILYGEKEAGDSVIPFRGMIDHGVRAVVELDQHAFHPMLALQVMISRKDITGKVWGAEQRVSREEALYAYTRWSAEYVLREKTMGSIEPKKLADFVVLNRDYLTVPEDEIGRLDSVMTVMDGKITYSQPEFASSQGLPLVGYQGDRSRWKRGTPADARIGFGPATGM